MAEEQMICPNAEEAQGKEIIRTAWVPGGLSCPSPTPGHLRGRRKPSKSQRHGGGSMCWIGAAAEGSRKLSRDVVIKRSKEFMDKAQS